MLNRLPHPLVGRVNFFARGDHRRRQMNSVQGAEGNRWIRIIAAAGQGTGLSKDIFTPRNQPDAFCFQIAFKKTK